MLCIIPRIMHRTFPVQRRRTRQAISKFKLFLRFHHCKTRNKRTLLLLLQFLLFHHFVLLEIIVYMHILLYKGSVHLYTTPRQTLHAPTANHTQKVNHMTTCPPGIHTTSEHKKCFAFAFSSPFIYIKRCS